MIATPDQRNRLMQMLKAETCVRRKYGTLRKSGIDEMIKPRRNFLWGLRPHAPGIYRIDAIPVNLVRG